MKIKEIVKLEENNHDKCYLIKEGLFWRAYEKSAFWFVDKLRSYMITKKHFKGLNADVAYIGFPNTVLSELLTLAESKGYIVGKPEKLVTISGIEISDGFEKWKKAIPNVIPDENTINSMVNEPEEKYDKVQGFAAPKGIATLILAKIKLFPTAERTPIQCQQFIPPFGRGSGLVRSIMAGSGLLNKSLNLTKDIFEFDDFFNASMSAGRRTIEGHPIRP
jgi:hypothetical protein